MGTLLWGLMEWLALHVSEPSTGFCGQHVGASALIGLAEKTVMPPPSLNIVIMLHCVLVPSKSQDCRQSNCEILCAPRIIYAGDVWRWLVRIAWGNQLSHLYCSICIHFQPLIDMGSGHVPMGMLLVSQIDMCWNQFDPHWAKNQQPLTFRKKKVRHTH